MTHTASAITHMENKANPFNLAGRDGPAAAPKARDWSDEEIAEKLVGYMEVPPQFWEHIRVGTHLRYFTKEGLFRAGGFVKNNPYDYRPRGATKDVRAIRLQNGFYDKAPGYVVWSADYENLAKVYIKPGAEAFVLLENLESVTRKFNENINKIVEHSRKLNQRIAALEKQLERRG